MGVVTGCVAPGAVAPLEDYPKSGRTKTAVDKHLNPALKGLNMREVRSNPDTEKVYPASLDGTQVENWLDDLYDGLVKNDPDVVSEWGLASCESSFLRGVTKAMQDSNKREDYNEVVRALPVLRYWVQGMRLALRMKPDPDDYVHVQEYLA
eukprot:6508647-Prymnesium_polylepis.1